MADKPLSGKVALVTGASSGIGAAAACALARDGARVAITFCRNRAGAEQCLAAVRAAGSEGVALEADFFVPQSAVRAVEAARQQLGPLDILVNNAGSLVRRRTLAELDEKTWDEAMNVNLKSAFMCSQAAAADMVAKKGGAIVNVASIAAHHGGGLGALHYAVAKAGLVAMTKALAKELAAHGVRANAVAPGTIDTAYHANFSDRPQLEKYVATIPMKRMGTPDEVAQVIAFLASDRASYLTGETIEVNGGVLMV